MDSGILADGVFYDKNFTYIDNLVNEQVGQNGRYVMGGDQPWDQSLARCWFKPFESEVHQIVSDIWVLLRGSSWAGMLYYPSGWHMHKIYTHIKYV